MVTVTVVFSGERVAPPARSVSDRLTQLVAVVTDSSTSTGLLAPVTVTAKLEPPPVVVSCVVDGALLELDVELVAVSVVCSLVVCVVDWLSEVEETTE